ncbi:vitamin B12 dependent-methionine synthase activation domain-containing protein [Bacteroidota bacterium]
MEGSLHFDINDIYPERDRVLNQIGVPADASINGKVEAALQRSLKLFETLAQPAGLMKGITRDEFTSLFKGEGENAEDAVLYNIYPRAENLSLFALTMGDEVSVEIKKAFESNDFPVGSLLDAAASVAADNAVTKIEDMYYDKLKEGSANSGNVVLSYSPGYCGWHISGQKKIFEFMKPSQIGISLNESFLMTPIKSVTGVLVGGKREIHIFDAKFKYCRDCRDKSCRERIKSILDGSKG